MRTRNTLNLGILAHVDAGKTSLTERLLHAVGVIDEPGSVDDGSTQTDTLALERQRGITIKSAVVSFTLGDRTVNLIDTPGHPDFIAEVERVLSLLDGAVLVISAVEGVQAQTRVLMRTLRRLGIPTLIFLNKTDRRGAQPARVLRDIAERLTPAAIPLCAFRNGEVVQRDPAEPGFAAELSEVLADASDAFLAAYVRGSVPPDGPRLRAELTTQTQRAAVHPVFMGSARTGAGVGALIEGLRELLPAPEADADGPLSGTVFKVERGPAGEKIAYARLFTGTVRTRDRLRFRGDEAHKVTAIRVFDRGAAVRRTEVVAGEIGQLWGLADVRIGDALGTPPTHPGRHHFSPPTLETAVVAADPAHKGALHAALTQLAEQDPLIDLRQDDVRQELFLSLYGEVQKEVIQETLAVDYGIAVDFRETTMICVERPVGSGESVEFFGRDPNPFLATVGLRVDPAPPGSGLSFDLGVRLSSIPMYVYKTVEEFRRTMTETVRETFAQGLSGWRVTDCAVTLTDSGYVSPSTTAREVRLLTPLVLMAALRQARTHVCEPVHHFRLEAPSDASGALLPVLSRLGAVPRTTTARGTLTVVEGDIPAARVHSLQQRLKGLTRGEGVVESAFSHYAPVTQGPPPTRPYTGPTALHRKEYLVRLGRWIP